MANPEHLAILKQGVMTWNAWREKAVPWPDLQGANLSGADLHGAILHHVNLNYADLEEANLCRANLRGSNLTGANLSQANVSMAHLGVSRLNGADLSSANLTATDLGRTDLSNADLSRANLTRTALGGAVLVSTNLLSASLDRTVMTGAHLRSTSFTDVDLSTTVGLEFTECLGPSSIGIDTIYKSRGQIPESFLRRCGVPDSFIAQARALIGAEEGVQFYSCFISYSGRDDEFARRLHGRLQQEHVRVWFAPHNVRGGQKLHEQIDEAIRVYDKLLIILSFDSILSEWVMTELRKARKAERKTGKRKLFPIRLVDYTTLTEWECFDADGGQDLATEVRQYFIPDFSNWKDHDAFEAGFARLMKDLRADEKAKV